MPLTGLREQAGFPQKKGSFYLPRAILPVPEELGKLLFPEVEKLELKLNDMNPSEVHISAKGFLDLMKYLRVVIIQDASIMEDLIPRVKKHRIFTGEAFMVRNY